MEFMKKYWFYILLGITVAAGLVQIKSMPDGVISTAPISTPAIQNPQFSAAAIADKDQAAAASPVNASGPVVVDGTTKVIAANDGKPVEIIIKHEHSNRHDGNDEKNDLGNDPRSLSSFFAGLLTVVKYLAWLAGSVIVIWIAIMLITGQWRNLFSGRGAIAQGIGGQSSSDKMGSMSISVIKPEDNKFRLSDFIGEEEVNKELIPLINAAKEQGIQTKNSRAAAVAAKKEEKPSASEEELQAVAASVPVPPIPTGRYGHVQNTRYILGGKPGTGKTLWPLVAAGESGITLITVAGTFQRIFIGAGTQNVDALVAEAKKHAPCIVFIDEAEEGAKQRSTEVGNGSANGDDSTAALLKAIDGVETKLGINQSNGIHWVLATNHVKKIDEAMKRAGRLKVLTFNSPSLENIKKLLRLFFGKLKKLPLAPDFNPNNVASILLGKTGADIEQLANEFAGLAEEIAAKEQKRLNAEAKAETKRLAAAGISAPKAVETQLQVVGLLPEQIEKHLDGLTFGHTEFVESVLRLLMGHKKTGIAETFEVVRDTAWHEGLHGLANVVMEHLGLLDWKVRFFTVGSRQGLLGLMYSSADDDASLMSIPNILARAVVAFAGGMGQLVGHDDSKRFGDEIDLYRDSGTTGDYEQAAEFIHRAISTFGGSLNIGPISKGQQGHTWFTEMGPFLVDEIDKEVRLRQKLGQFMAWRIASILMQNDVAWNIFDEVLNTPERIILQDRFYELFDQIMLNKTTKDQISALPGEYIELASDEAAALAWQPTRQPPEARSFITKKTTWLEARYLEVRRLEAQQAAEIAAAELEDVPAPAGTV